MHSEVPLAVDRSDHVRGKGWLHPGIVNVVMIGLFLLLAACRPGSSRNVRPPDPASSVVNRSARRTAPVQEESSDASGAPKKMVICMGGEPNSLLWSETALVTRAVLEAVQEPLIDSRNYSYQANLVEKLPSFSDGDATLEPVMLHPGDRFYDVLSDEVLTLSHEINRPFGLNQFEGDMIVIEEWDGQPLPTVQMGARWTLVDGLQWEDGEPVTADDSVYAFEIASDPAWPTTRYLIDRTQSYTALDERTIEWQGLPGYTDGTYFRNLWNPQPRHAQGHLPVADLLKDERARRAPLSYGPYRIDRWIAGERIELLPNEAYLRGEPPIDRLVFRFIQDTEALIDQVLAGDCDLGTQDAAFEAWMRRLRAQEERGKLDLLIVAGTAFEHLDFNIRPVDGYEGAASRLTDQDGRRLLAHPDFRRAVAHCIDRQEIVDRVTQGSAFIQHSYTGADHPLYPGDGMLTIYDHDPERGRRLLASLGWTDTDGDGIVDNGQGETLSFIYSTRRNPLRAKVTRIVQEQLRTNCGIDTTIEMHGSDYFADGPQGLLFGRRYDMGQFAWLTGVEPPCNLYLTAQIPDEDNGWGSNNNTGFSNEAFDTACNGALQTLDAELKAQQHAEAMRIFTEQLPAIPLFAPAKIAIAHPGVEGVVMDPTANSELWNVENFDIIH